MDRNSFVIDVYEKVSDKFCENIPESDKLSTKEKYIEYLHKTYDEYFAKASDEELSQEALFCVKKESVVNLKKNADEKKAWLFPDEKYLSLEALFLEISSFATGTRSLDDLTKTKEDYLKELKQLFDDVSPLFKYGAERIFSEAVLDLGKIFGDTNFSGLGSRFYIKE